MEKTIHPVRRGRKRVNFDPYLKHFTCYYCKELIAIDASNIKSVRFSTKKGECRVCHNDRQREQAARRLKIKRGIV